MSLQESFDADLRRAMSRRQFLTRLARASARPCCCPRPWAAGSCGAGSSICVSARRRRRSTPCNRRSSPKSSTASIRPTPRSGSGSRRRIRTTIRSPPTAEFAWASGDEFLANMRFLIDFVNILPTLTRTFSNRYGLPAHLAAPAGFTPTMRTATSSSCATATSGRSGTSSPGRSSSGRRPSTPTRRWPGRSCAIRVRGCWIRRSPPGISRTPPPSTWLGRPTRTWPSCDAGSWPTAPCARASRPPGRGRIRPPRAGDRHGRGGLRGGRIVRGRRARGEDDQRVLVLEKGDFIEPMEFLQRERLMMPRIFDTEFSVLQIFGREIPTVSTAVVTGKLVGGSATINHALAFEPPRPVIRDWHDRLGASSATTTSPPTWRRSERCCGSPPCPIRRSPAATSCCAGGSRRWACRTTARPSAMRISASGAATAIWAVATIASSPR